MTELNREALLGVVRQAWNAMDPVPDDLIVKMQAVVASEQVTDLDYELLVLVERSRELAGTRGGSSYTLQFAHGDVALLVRAAGAEEGTSTGRLDGWLAPAVAMTVRASRVDDGGGDWDVEADHNGRFEFKNLPSGLFRLWLTPRDAGGRAFGTPAFEI
jgi:hypothetical protein